jgi:ubiquinone/menaquinone biosynthesis C-methylase UbiE
MKKKTDYNKIVTGYYDLIYKKKKGIQSAWHHIKFNFIKKKIDKKIKHLDIGCGPGTFIGLIKKAESIGIDISKNQILYAKKNYSNNHKSFYVFKKKIPLKDNSIDTITLIELIEHLNKIDLAKLMFECMRILKKNGKIIITTPNYFSLWPLLELILNFISPISYKHQHINKFDKKKLKNFLINHNLKIDKIESFILISPFLAPLSFKFSLNFILIDNLLCKIFPGFLLYSIARKKNSS